MSNEMKVLMERKERKAPGKGEGVTFVHTPICTVHENAAKEVRAKMQEVLYSGKNGFTVVVATDLPHYPDFNTFDQEFAAKKAQEQEDKLKSERQKALTKLTKAQRELLGLPDPEPKPDDKTE
tara:strand:+ start:762 stop:1130 length:369 start_codon:yes stop_codon:yes gene_type:complete